MLKNSAGKADAMLTFSAGAVAVCIVKVGLAGVVAFGFTFGPAPDATVIAALLTPTLGAYVARRNELGVKAIAPGSAPP